MQQQQPYRHFGEYHWNEAHIGGLLQLPLCCMPQLCHCCTHRPEPPTCIEGNIVEH